MSKSCKVIDCSGKPVGRGWCGKHYARARRHNWTLDGTTEYGLPVHRRILQRSFVDRDTGCWVSRNTHNGYPRVTIGTKGADGVLDLHRIMCERRHGPLRQGQQARHLCGNPACFNPAHLAPGSAFDNAQDMIGHGRSLTGGRNHKAKLTDSDVLEIRNSAESGTALAQKYGVGKATISSIRHRRTWRHI